MSTPERVLFVGFGRLAERLLRERRRPGCAVYTQVGLVTDDRLDQLGPLVRESRADRIVVTPSGERDARALRGLMDCWIRGVAVETIEDFYERVTGRIAIESVRPSGLVFTPSFRRPALQRALARITSLLAGALGLPLLLPLFGLIALAIKLDSRGPVFFTQERIGLNGKPFRLVKFRTMHPVQGSHSEWVRDNRHRITRVGRWLRHTRADELPQFLNILRGEMNLVGPRPHPASNLPMLVTVFRNTPECGAEIPYYSLRTLVRPGVTGWAQVRYGYANDVQEEVEKLSYDLYYVKHASPWLDLRILGATIGVVLRGDVRRSSPAEDTELEAFTARRSAATIDQHPPSAMVHGSVSGP